MTLTQKEREAAYERVRGELGVGRMGTGRDASPLPPRHGGATAFAALPIEAEMLGAQMFEYEVWARPGISLHERSFMTVAVLAAIGRGGQLYEHVNVALNLGITPEEIHETLLHVSVYAGLPAWEDGVAVAREVFAARGVVPVGAGSPVEPKPPTTDGQRRAARDGVLSTMGVLKMGTGPDARPLAPLPGPAAVKAGSRLAIEDDVSAMYAEHGLGEVWARPGLEIRTRSLITLSMLQAHGEMDHLHVHVNNALNLGITPEEIHEVLAHTGIYAGLSGWNSGMFVARDVFVQRGIVQPPAPVPAS